MKQLIGSLLVVGLLAMAPVMAQDCDGPTVGPAPCVEDATAPPKELCLGSHACGDVVYQQSFPWAPSQAWFVQATTEVDGYLVSVVVGPCMPGWDCPALYWQAFDALRVEGLKATRVLRFEAQ